MFFLKLSRYSFVGLSCLIHPISGATSVPRPPTCCLCSVFSLLICLRRSVSGSWLTTVDSRTGTAIGISTSAILFWLVAPWFLEVKYFFSPAILLFIGIGLIRPALSANLGTAGIRFLGPTLSNSKLYFTFLRCCSRCIVARRESY